MHVQSAFCCSSEGRASLSFCANGRPTYHIALRSLEQRESKANHVQLQIDAAAQWRSGQLGNIGLRIATEAMWRGKQDKGLGTFPRFELHSF